MAPIVIIIDDSDSEQKTQDHGDDQYTASTAADCATPQPQPPRRRLALSMAFSDPYEEPEREYQEEMERLSARILADENDGIGTDDPDDEEKRDVPEATPPSLPIRRRLALSVEFDRSFDVERGESRRTDRSTSRTVRDTAPIHPGWTPSAHKTKTSKMRASAKRQGTSETGVSSVMESKRARSSTAVKTSVQLPSKPSTRATSTTSAETQVTVPIHLLAPAIVQASAPAQASSDLVVQLLTLTPNPTETTSLRQLFEPRGPATTLFDSTTHITPGVEPIGSVLSDDDTPTAFHAVAATWPRALWPPDVVHLRENYNLRGLEFANVSDFGMCECAEPCRHTTCLNARLDLFCTPRCCSFDADCGVGLKELDEVVLSRRPGSNERILVASKPIDRSVIIGEYLGELRVEAVREKNPVRNNGYLLQLRQRCLQHPASRVYIDATRYGSKLRFLNHSCNPATRFFEVSNGRRHTVVAVTYRAIKRGDEITVSYGDAL